MPQLQPPRQDVNTAAVLGPKSVETQKHAELKEQKKAKEHKGGDVAAVRDIEEELEHARKQGLQIPEDQVGKKTTCKWSTEERHALLGFLSDGKNYKKIKRSADKVWISLSQNNGLFRGTRSKKAIKSHWEDVKRKFEEAKRSINRTGEGVKSEEQWSSMEKSWLNKLCPDYRLIAEILQKDKTFTAPFVSETGGPLPRKVVEGVDDAGNKESDSSASEKEIDGLNTSDDSDENTGESDSDAHPPTGGQKNPTKKKRKAKKRGTQSTRAVKKIKKSNKEKWAYIQRQDNEDRKLAVLKEKNRKEEQARRDALEDRREQRLDAELQLRLRQFDQCQQSAKKLE